MSFMVRKKAIIRCGSDRDLVLIFNHDLKKHYLKIGEGIPLHLFRSIIHLHHPDKVQKAHPDFTFFEITSFMETIRERNGGVFPPTLIDL